MELTFENKVFTVICIAILPLTVLFIIFNFVVILASSHRSIDLITCSVLLARLGHSGAVVTMMAVYSLELWDWTKSTCQAMLWMWITSWMLDLLVNLMFLVYTATTLGQIKNNVRCHMFVLIIVSWGISVAVGALSFLADTLFYNYNENQKICLLGLSITEKSFGIGAMLVLIIGGLLVVVLTITVSAESRAQSAKHKLRHHTNSSGRQEIAYTGASPKTEEAKNSRNELSKNGSLNRQQTNSSLSTVTEGHLNDVDLETEHRDDTCGDYDRRMKDTRRIHSAASWMTIFFNVLPQLVSIDNSIDR